MSDEPINIVRYGPRGAAVETHWYQISPETTITCVCVHGKDHGDEGYNVPPGDEVEPS